MVFSGCVSGVVESELNGLKSPLTLPRLLYLSFYLLTFYLAIERDCLASLHRAQPPFDLALL
jgi:hypothetical protein